MNQEPEGMEIELLDLLDLGDATIETRQWSLYPIWYDSVFLLGEIDP